MVKFPMKRDIQGKFALKNDDYRLVRSLRLTDETWKALGIASECSGRSRADYLEEIVRCGALPHITREDKENLPCNTRKNLQPQPRMTGQTDNSSPHNTNATLGAATALPLRTDVETLRNRVLRSLKLGKQAPGYKTAQKALNQFIAELTSLA